MGKKRSSYLYVPLLAIVVFGVSSYVMNHNYDGKSGDNSQIYYVDEYFHAQETKVPDAHAVDKKDALYDAKQCHAPDKKKQGSSSGTLQGN